MEGKVALITGGARGIGRAFAKKLLSHGGQVILVDIDDVTGKATETALTRQYGDGVVLFKCDVTSKRQMQDAFEATLRRFGKLDILCNNAGILFESQGSPEKMIAVNLTSVIHWTMMGIQYMSSPIGHGGVIINTASNAAVVPTSSFPIYTATKHGVLAFTRGIGAESQRRYNIRINCICPSGTETELYLAFSRLDKYKEIVATAEKTYGLMQPEEVADAFYELLHMDSLSGAAMIVSKGTRRVLNLPTHLENILVASDSLAR